MAPEDQDSVLKDVPLDLLVAYYEHQYDRIKQQEDQRFTITNIIVGISAIVFTFGFDKTAAFSMQTGYALLATVIVVNLFAIAFIIKSESWIDTHRKRAKGVLAARSQELLKFDRDTHGRIIRAIPGRWSIQVYLHVILMIIAIIMIVAWSIS